MRSSQHLPYRENKPLTGTVRYASINTHLGIEQSRRDDLESLGYMFAYFLRGSLPWQVSPSLSKFNLKGLKATAKEDKYKLITLCKIDTSLEDLTSGLPDEVKTYLNYCRSLKFHSTPDYTYLRGLFNGLLEKLVPNDTITFLIS